MNPIKLVATTLLLACLLPSAAQAQCSGQFADGQFCGNLTGSTNFPRPTQLFNLVLPLTGGTLTGPLITATSATGAAGLRLPPGVAPTSPVNGDIWTTSAGIFVRINGSTVGPLSTGGGGGGSTTLTGDVTGTGTGTFATTLATVNSNVGAFGSSTAIPVVTVNGKGLVTAASTAAVVAPAGTLTGTTLAANVVASSITSVGVLSGGSAGAGFTLGLSTATLTGTLAVASGGTGAGTASAALTNLGALPLAGGTMGGTLLLAADPITGLGAATKAYVDSVVDGLQAKSPVVAATTANITLVGEQTLDGVLTSTSRVLVKNQAAPAENGIYVTAAGAWTRATDLDIWTEAVHAFTLITGGSTQTSTGWTAQASAGGTIGVTDMPWVQTSSQVTYGAGAGLSLVGTTFAVAAGGVTNTMLAGSIAASKLVGSDIATVGTITAGTWHGTAIGSQYGGTGQDWSASSGIPLITAGTGSLLSSSGSGNVVRVTGATAASLTVTGAFTATGLVTNADLVNPAVTLGATALTLGATVLDFQMTNNHIIQWKDSGGSNINALYLDSGNRFQVGGGDNVAIAATQGSTSSSTGALQVAGGIYVGPKSFFQGGSNGTGTTFTINERTRGDSDTSFYVATGSSANDFVVKTSGAVGIGTTSPTGFGGNTLMVSTAGAGGGTIRLIDSAITNANWAFLASTGGVTPLFRIYNAAQGLDRFVIDATGSIGLSGLQNPSTLGAGQGIAVGGAGNVGTIFVNPYVDSNYTTSGLVVKLNDQPAANTYGTTGYEYAIVGTILSTHNDTCCGLQANKVGVQGSAQASGGNSGNVWGLYGECQLDSGSAATSACIGAELDVNNLRSAATDLNHPAYGLQLTGSSSFPNTAALLVSGGIFSNNWAAGIVFQGMASTSADYGIDLAFDTNTFGQAAIRIPNNQTIAWKQSGGGNVNVLYLDAGSPNVFQVGGGLPVAMTGLGATSQTNVLCFNSGTGLITYQTWSAGCATSSARFKKDIREVSPAQSFAIASKLLAVRYQYRPEVDMGSDEHLGFTAEQAASVDPELVTYDDQGRPNAVKYQEMAPILAGAIQYLKAANDNLAARLLLLEQRTANP